MIRLYGYETDHQLVLRLRVPAHVVAQIDAADAHSLELVVERIDERLDVPPADPCFLSDHFLCVNPLQAVLFSSLLGHLHLVEMREHPDLIRPAVDPPDDEGHTELDGSLHRER